MRDSHPLFDPDSCYSRLRAAVPPQERVRGYFRWLAAEHSRAALLGVAAAPAAPPPHLVLRVDRPEEALAAEVRVRLSPPGREERHVSLTLETRDYRPAGRLTCRAFLVEPAIARQLGGPGALRHVFRRETLARDFEAARVLSALPELEGGLEGGCARFERVVLPPGCGELRALPGRVLVVVAVDAAAGGPA